MNSANENAAIAGQERREMNGPDFKQGSAQFRILFGPLFGLDISVPGDEIFFRVGEGVSDDADSTGFDTGGDHYLSRAIKTLYIPYRAGLPNFRLRFAQQVSSSRHDFEVDVFSAQGGETQCAAFNTICRFGEIVFAVKRHAEAWSDEVLRYTPPVVSVTARPEMDKAAMPRSSPLRWALVLGTLLILCTGLAYWRMQHPIRSVEHLARSVPHPVNTQTLDSVRDGLASSPVHNVILPASDGRTYVLSPSQDDAEWDRQALLKAGLTDRVEVATLAAEQQRLMRRLDEAGIDFLTLRLDVPEHPELVVSGTLPLTTRESAVSALRDSAPYARDIRTVTTNIDTIDLEARNALERVGARYRVVARPGGATFVVTSSFGDEELAALQNLLSSFNHKWGTRRVDFKIALRPDWLKGKSYLGGEDGFVLLDPASWYFPQPLKGTNLK